MESVLEGIPSPHRRTRRLRVGLAFATILTALGAERGRAGDLAASQVLIGGDDRLAPAAFAAKLGLSGSQLTERFGATGRVRCGGAIGTGQLVGSNNVLVTAAHVLFSPAGKPRGGACTFDIDTPTGRQIIPVRVSDIECGSRTPYADPALHDWAVVPLARAVPGVRGYPLGSALKVPGALVLATAARMDGTETHLLELCRAHQVTGHAADGMREVAIDCDAEGGTSGAALLGEDGSFRGVYVGFRSAHPGTPGPFSMSHYNFGVTAEGRLRQAIMSVVSRNAPMSASME